MPAIWSAPPSHQADARSETRRCTPCSRRRVLPKSNKPLGKTTITNARKALCRHDGRCTPESLLFVANRLLESDDEDDVALGRTIRDGIGDKTFC
jgi:hypothetical protein